MAIVVHQQLRRSEASRHVEGQRQLCHQRAMAMLISSVSLDVSSKVKQRCMWQLHGDMSLCGLTEKSDAAHRAVKVPWDTSRYAARVVYMMLVSTVIWVKSLGHIFSEHSKAVRASNVYSFGRKSCCTMWRSRTLAYQQGRRAQDPRNFDPLKS